MLRGIARLPPAIALGAMRDDLVAHVESLPMGDLDRLLANFLGAVIDRRAFSRLSGVLDRARADDALAGVAGGRPTTARGSSSQPTVLECTDPTHEIFTTEYFGPVLAVHVFDDGDSAVVAQAADAPPYALTGAVFAQDRAAITEAPTCCATRPATSTSTTSPPAPSWVSNRSVAPGRAGPTTRRGHRQPACGGPARAIKETFVPATDWRYPHMG